MSAHTYIVVEGPQDAEVIAGLLRPEFERVVKTETIPIDWRRFIPRPGAITEIPYRVANQPVFLSAKDGRTALIRVAGSDDRIATVLAADLKELKGSLPRAVGVVMDADDHPVSDRLETEDGHLAEKGLPFRFGGLCGTLSDVEGVRRGMFVVPDNASQGGMETLMIEGAKANFSSLLAKAKEFVEAIETTDVPEGRGRWEQFVRWSRSKSVVHAVVSILKPGRPTAASLADDGWFSASTPDGRVENLRSFLRALTAV